MDYRQELVKICALNGCKNADEILEHILHRTGLVFKEPKDIDNNMAKYLLSEFEINKKYQKTGI